MVSYICLEQLGRIWWVLVEVFGTFWKFFGSLYWWLRGQYGTCPAGGGACDRYGKGRSLYLYSEEYWLGTLGIMANHAISLLEQLWAGWACLFLILLKLRISYNCAMSGSRLYISEQNMDQCEPQWCIFKIVSILSGLEVTLSLPHCCRHRTRCHKLSVTYQFYESINPVRSRSINSMEVQILSGLEVSILWKYKSC